MWLFALTSGREGMSIEEGGDHMVRGSEEDEEGLALVVGFEPRLRSSKFRRLPPPSGFVKLLDAVVVEGGGGTRRASNN